MHSQSRPFTRLDSAGLVSAQHKPTGFKIHEADELCVPTCGVRQGCRFGAILFNAQYARALADLKAALAERNLLVKREYLRGALPWAHAPDAVPGEDDEVAWDRYAFSDATYVDDAAIYFSADNCWQLLDNAAVLLRVASDVCAR